MKGIKRMANFFNDQYLCNLLRDVGSKLNLYDFIEEANQAGLEYDKYFEDLEVKKIKINELIEKLINHIKKVY